MTLRIQGFLRKHQGQQLIDAPLAPFVSAAVGDTSPTVRVDFMIDTGADFSIISQRDVLRLFGKTPDFSGVTSNFVTVGVAGINLRIVPMPTQLRFTADDGKQLIKFRQIAISIPPPPQHFDTGDWLTPSLFGRDLLQEFDLHLSYHPPSVTLTEAPPSS